MSRPTIREAVREFRITLAGAIYPDLRLRVEVEETLDRLDALGLTDEQKRQALDAATKAAAAGAGDLLDAVAKISAKRTLDGLDLYALSQCGIKIQIYSRPPRWMAGAR